jgi:hypothetical protein
MKDKSKVYEIFKKFSTRSQNEFDVKIKRVRSDNGIELKNTMSHPVVKENQMHKSRVRQDQVTHM